jgi:hypothetical protein
VALKTSEVYRALQKKTLVFGFEIVDLFVVFSLLAFLNLILRGVAYKFIWTWGPAMGLALFLRMGKAGKPENYLLHLARFYFLPPVFSAFPLAPRRGRFIHLRKGKQA